MNLFSKQFRMRAVRATLWLSAATLLFMTSCLRDDLTPTAAINGEKARVTFSLTVPANSSPTRSMDETAQKDVQTIDVLVFEDDKLWYCSSTDDITSMGTNKKTFTVEMIQGEGNDLVILANARGILEEISSTVVKGAAKETVMNALSMHLDNVWNVAADSYMPFPMSSDPELTSLKNVTIEHDKAITGIKLYRMVAKIDVVLGSKDGVEAKEKFNLTSVHVYNRNTDGYLKPVFDGAGYVLNANNSRVEGISSDGFMVYSNEGSSESIQYIMADDDGKGYACKNVIFLFEIENTPASTSYDRPCLVIGGFYGDETESSYYRIDFTNDGVNYLDILRNHQYIVNINSVGGTGWRDPDEAYKAAPVNMECEIVAWEDGGMDDVTYNGQYQLVVNKAEYIFTSTGAEQILEIYTDCPAGWQIEESSIPDWVTLTPVSGNANTVASVGISCEDYPDEVRSGSFWIVSGPLRKEILITQTKYFPAYAGVIGYDPATGKLNLDGIGDMMYFKFGGVVGSAAPITGGAWNNNYVSFNPSDYTTADFTQNGSSNTFPSVPGFVGADDYMTLSVYEIAYHNKINVKLGKGDPCKLVGLTKEEIQSGIVDNGQWRMPTHAETMEFTGLNNAVGFTDYGNVVYPYYVANGSSATNPAMMYFPIGGGTTVAENTDRFLNIDGKAIPAAGYYSDGNQSLTMAQVVGIGGQIFLWESLGAASNFATCTRINGTNIVFSNVRVTNSLPIRCVPAIQLNISQTDVRVVGAGTEQTVQIYTDYPTGWEVASKPDWVTTATPTSGSVYKTIDFTFGCHLNNSGDTRIGYIVLKAGEITKQIKITQDEHLMYVGRFGGKLVRNMDGVWYFEKKLYVQAGDTHKSVVWYSDNATVSGVMDKVEGKLNTFTLYNMNTGYASAAVCYNKNTGTITRHTDLTWYLPAQKQMQAIWISDNTYPESSLLGTGHASGNWYHTSTEAEMNSNMYHWLMHSSNGRMVSTTKTVGFPVRCVREHPII